MESPPDEQILVEFEGGVLSPVTEQQRPRRTYRIGWFLQSVDVNSASIRYRCFHFARVLAPAFESVYLTSVAEVQAAARDLDAIIIVKRIDRPVLEVVALARQFQVPVFLDLCDDLIASGYSKNDFGVNLLHLLGVAPFLAGVTVPSADMADRIQAYAADHGQAQLKVHVVPDIAETWDIYKATFKAVSGSKPKAEPIVGAPAPSGLKQVLWFGNYGASHSNFGIFSLKRSLKALGTVHQEIPLELVVVSNSEPVYRALVQDCGFPTRYVPWAADVVYSELARADVALLTSGDDDFCSIKSSNRTLQALAADVPVIAAKGSALAEFDDAIFAGRLEDNLRSCLGPQRAQIVPVRMAAARRVLERYTPERLGAIWALLLERAIDDTPSKVGTAAGKALFVCEPGDRMPKVLKMLSAANKTPGLDYDLLVSTDLLEEQPDFSLVLSKSRAIPRFFSGKLKGARNLLLGSSVLVVDRVSAPVAKMLSGFAGELGIPVLTTDEAMDGALGSFGTGAADAAPARSSIKAGPYEERLNPDGSVDWAFVVHENARGWILDAICREIGSRQPDSWKIVYYPETPPNAKNLFFSHYSLIGGYVKRHAEMMSKAKVFVWYTHPREEDPVSVAKLLRTFDDVTKVIFTCESNRRIWIERGLDEDKAQVILGAADPKMFRFHERGNGVVGLSSSFYERKNPDCLMEVIKLLPHRQFLLLGRKWNQYAGFEQMKALPNFTYRSVSYRDYPDIYATFDVFLSMSSLEGGPIPLVEAMMSNAVPVASRTGFAPDLIRHGENGFIFDLDARPETIAELIEQAFASKTDVRATVERYDWESFSAAVVKLAE